MANSWSELRLGNATNTGGCIAVCPNGKRAIVHGGLPFELVRAVPLKVQSKLDNYLVTEVLEASEHRCMPCDSHYLATSPWQCVNFRYENLLKSQLIVDAFKLNKLSVNLPEMKSDGQDYEYRNKYTYKFTGIDYQFGVTERLGHKVIPVSSSSLAQQPINQVANQVVQALRQKPVIAPEHLNQLIIRISQSHQVIAQVVLNSYDYTNQQYFAIFGDAIENIELSLQTNRVNAQARTLWTKGNTALTDEVCGQKFSYDIHCFFQTNLPVYQMALCDIAQFILEQNTKPVSKLIDLYSGVGSIGLSILPHLGMHIKQLLLVDIDKRNNYWTQTNIKQLLSTSQNANLVAKAICVRADRADHYITSDTILILDPPRAGVAKQLVETIMERKPAQILYLSCNPSTLARDVHRLSNCYRLKHLVGYNFFPKTPHIEALASFELI